MLLKRPKAKKFDYTPRFYNPETDPDEKRKKRLGFRSARQAKRKKRSPIYWLLIIIVIMYIYLRFRGYL